MSAPTYDTIVASPSGGWLCQQHGAYRLWWQLAATADSWIAQIERQALAAVPAVALASAPAVALERSGATATVTLSAGRSSWQLAATDGWPQPTPPAVEGAWADGRLLSASWKPVLACMSTDRSRYAMCGLEVVVARDQLQLTSTDGYRLSVARSDLPVGADVADGSGVLPADAARWLAKQRGWRWRQTATGFEAAGDGWRLAAEAVLGYPDYRRILAAAGNGIGRCTLSADALAAAAKTLTVGKPPHRLRLDWGGGQLQLTGRGFAPARQAQPTAAATLAAATDGAAATLLVDPDLLRPMLAALGKTECTLHFVGPTQPLSVTAGDWTGVLMVCRLDD